MEFNLKFRTLKKVDSETFVCLIHTTIIMHKGANFCWQGCKSVNRQWRDKLNKIMLVLLSKYSNSLAAYFVKWLLPHPVFLDTVQPSKVEASSRRSGGALVTSLVSTEVLAVTWRIIATSHLSLRYNTLWPTSSLSSLNIPNTLTHFRSVVCVFVFK